MKVKKIAALAIGAAMVGATIGFASAQPTVPEIPKDFFVKDGQPNAKIVVGSQGAALDVSSAADIAVAIGSMLYTEKTVQANGTSVVLKKDISYQWDIQDLPVFGGSTSDPTSLVVFNEDEFANPEKNEDAWAKWYVNKEGSINLVPKNVTLIYNSYDGEDIPFVVPLDGTTVTGPDGKNYSVVNYYDILGDNPTIVVEVTGEDGSAYYALRKGETQILDFKPEYEDTVTPSGKLVIPITLGDVTTEPYSVVSINVPDYDLDGIEVSDKVLYAGDKLTYEIPFWNNWTEPFNITMTDVNLTDGWAVLKFNWSTSNYVKYVDVEDVDSSGSSVLTSTPYGSSVQVNVTAGDIVTFYTDDGIFDFNVTKIGESSSGVPYARLDFTAEEYGNKYKVDGTESTVLDVHYDEVQKGVRIWAIVPANVTFEVLDVNLDENNAWFKIISNFYNASDSAHDYITPWQVNFTMTPTEEQYEPVLTYDGNIFDFYISLNKLDDEVTGVPIVFGNSTGLEVGDWWVVGSFNITLVETEPITLHITNVTGSDLIVDTYVELPGEEANKEIPFQLESIPIDVTLVSESLSFEKVSYTTETVYEDGMTDFVYSEWADNEWDLGIDPGVVKKFVEWTIPNDDTYYEKATVAIDKIVLKDLKKKVENNVPPKDATIVIPKGAIHVDIDLGYETGKYYTYSNYLCKLAGCDPDVEKTYLDMDSDETVPGAYAGDVLTFPYFNKSVSILEIGDNYFTYGTSYGTDWYKVGDEKTFEDYTIKVLDINIFESKVLLEVSMTGESPEMYSVKIGDTLHYYGLYVTVDDAFIGSTEDVIAKLSVKVEKGKVISGSEKKTLVPGYITYLDIKEDEDGYKYIDSVEFVNAKEISGDTVDVFNTYEIKYVYTEKSATCVKDDEEVMKYFVNAYVEIDPYPYYVTRELSVGDMLYDEYGMPTGWVVDKINADSYQEITVVPPTEPITVLDTEIMEAGLDKVDSNLILIGGPVVNSVTAALAEKLEVPSDYDSWKEEYGTGADSGVVKYIAECGDINGYGVVLVAGTDREGTKAAAEALMEYLAGL